MSSPMRWLRPRQAARLVARTRNVSLGAALPILREAMVSGDVRVRWRAPDAEAPVYPPAHLWTSAQFDLEQDTVTADDQWRLDRGLRGQRQYDALQISADDLRDSLRRNHPASDRQRMKGANPQPKPSAASGGLGAGAQGKPKRRDKSTKLETVRKFLDRGYPHGIPAGLTDKEIARKFGAEAGVNISERTVRRARSE